MIYRLLITVMLITTISASVCATALQDLSSDISTLVKNASPSIVEIRVERDVKNNLSNFLMQRSVGTGFVIDSKGFILTSTNVVKDTETIKVKFPDGTEADARLMGTDQLTNAAVVKVDKTGLKALQLGNSDPLQPGSIVVSINNQTGLTNSVSLGVVAGVMREVAGNSTGLLQISGTVGPGASGGPVFDSTGKVIGMTTAMFSTSSSALPFNTPNIFFNIPQRSGKSLEDLEDELAVLRTKFGPLHPEVVAKQAEIDSRKRRQLQADDGVNNNLTDIFSRLQNIQGFDSMVGNVLDTSRTVSSSGFAVPIDKIKPILDELKSGKEIERPMLGLILANRDDALVVEKVMGPAEKAGIKPGDLLLKADGKVFKSVQDFANYIQTRKVGEDVTLVIRRQGEDVEIPVKLENRAEQQTSTASIDQRRAGSNKVFVLGEVTKPGVYEWTEGITVLKALDQAGGPTTKAKLNDALILRGSTQDPEKIKVNIGKMLSSGDPSTDVKLQAGDRLYIPSK